MTNEIVDVLNSKLNASRIFNEELDDKIDLVQVSQSWIKVRMKSSGNTYLVDSSCADVVKQQFQDSALHENQVNQALRSKYGKDVVFNAIDEETATIAAEALSSKFKEITTQASNLDDVVQLVGPCYDFHRMLFNPCMPYGNEIDEGVKTCVVVVNGIPHMLYDTQMSQMNTYSQVWKELVAPLAWYGKKLDDMKIDESSKEQATAKDDEGLDSKNALLRDVENTIDAKNSSIKMTSKQIQENVKHWLKESNSIECAQRRQKLFTAAQHLGATIIEDGNWIAAICYEYSQCHVFGRLKPKVKPGTNEIDPACNLEDWEGITPENKAKRDNPGLPWVQDNIDDGYGHLFNKLTGESGQPKESFGCETAWCNCGVLNKDSAWTARDKSNMYFEYYNNGGKTPYVILMDMNRGALYQYVKIKRYGVEFVNFLNENDKVDGGRVGNPPDKDQIQFFNKFYAENKDFAKLIDEINAKYFDV